jgi:putative ABC transport system substrate-binding protein
VAFGNEFALKAAMAASSTVPIVMMAIDYDPLALGYIKSLARPGGNVTGLFLQQVELAEKRVELVKQLFPELAAATMLWDAPSASQWQATQHVAPALGLDIIGIEMRDRPYDYERALSDAPTDHRKVLIVGNSAGFFSDRSRLGAFTLDHVFHPSVPHVNLPMLAA